jgi:TAT (twin-arginine translocation) pathway signal sequence
MTGTGEPSRRNFLKGAVGVTAAGGTLAILDQLAGGITRAEAAPNPTASTHDEQYLVDGLEAITDNGVRVMIPPLYKYIITAKLRRDRTWNAKALQAAQKQLEGALARVEQGRPRTAAGLTMVVAWGLPYFENFAKPALSSSSWPRDVSGSSTTDAVLDAIRFPSDPGDLVFEDNEVMFMFRSDSLATLDDVKGTLFSNPGQSGYIGGLFEVTSHRTGFVGRGFDKPSVAKQLALQAGVAGAAKIPDRSQLMMGFTSTQQAALGPGNIVNFETLRLTNVKPGDYFAGGCAMHLSHIYEDLSLWYGFGYADQVQRMFSAQATATAGTVTLPNGPANVTSRKQLLQDAKKGLVGHNETLQQATRLAADVVDAYGVNRPAGTPVPIREDFNTLDQPFTSSGAAQNTPGLHFVAFVPTSGRFHLARQAMDGILPDGTDLKVATKDNGINGMLHTTHRQNFLVPPRSHRSFPWVEMLA